ncbi:MAG: hypothetical protein HRU70_05875 [Phycisphaeraceae bacterium]|nr:MAG: hypothetical protein HRU70_05875 [Phycisphaeraceae bacterium]
MGRPWFVNAAATILGLTALAGARLWIETPAAREAPAHLWSLIAPQPKAKAKDLGIPYDRYETKDTLGRDITYYLSPAPAGAPDPGTPLALFIQGSGASSVFMKAPDGRLGGGLQNLLLRDANNRFRVMVVEKPGVEFLDAPEHPGSAINAPPVFRREHTYERWREALRAALDAALATPGIDASRVLVVGHSEGADMAAALAAVEPRVTHAACLAGGGPTQLFDLAQLARAPQTPDEPEAEREDRVEEVYRAWERIAADPDNPDALEWGHPHARWSSFMRHSAIDALSRSNARVYLAYGTNDRAVPVESNDALRAELVVRGRDVTVERRVGEDHGFATPGGPQGAAGGFGPVFGHVIDWWLEPAKG